MANRAQVKLLKTGHAIICLAVMKNLRFPLSPWKVQGSRHERGIDDRRMEILHFLCSQDLPKTISCPSGFFDHLGRVLQSIMGPESWVVVGEGVAKTPPICAPCANQQLELRPRYRTSVRRFAC